MVAEQLHDAAAPRLSPDGLELDCGMLQEELSQFVQVIDLVPQLLERRFGTTELAQKLQAFLGADAVDAGVEVGPHQYGHVDQLLTGELRSFQRPGKC